MERRPLILIGGGGHCRSVIEGAESSGMEIAGVLDLPGLVGSAILGYPVVGTDSDIEMYSGEFDFIVTVGQIKDGSIRRSLAEKVSDAGGRLGKVTASSAAVSPHAFVGGGTVILHHASVNAGARVGRNCIVNTASNIEHDAAVGDNVHISTGAMVNGGAEIGDGCFIGSGAVICHGVRVCAGCVIGAGCVVTEDITEPGTYVGVPAHRTI